MYQIDMEVWINMVGRLYMREGGERGKGGEGGKGGERGSEGGREEQH